MKKDLRTELIQIRVTPAEKKQLLEWADLSQMKFQVYARNVLMQGYTFSLQVNEPAKELTNVEIEPVDEVGGIQQKQRKHGSG